MPGDCARYVLDWRNAGLWRNKRDMEIFLGAPVRIRIPGISLRHDALSVWIGWGRKKSGDRARKSARASRGRYLLLEDGFLRSCGLGVNGARALSIVTDSTGIYYDATRPNDLENLLNTGGFSGDEIHTAQQIIKTLRDYRLSKYNNGLPVPSGFFPKEEERVLVIDQTFGDLSLQYGLAGPDVFAGMLQAAVEENPRARIYVKTHPDVLAGRKRGCLPPVKDDNIRWLTENWHPHDLLGHFGKIYVATSLMGLDALILGKDVHCFGMPFYAGWGLTHDRQNCSRRKARRTLPELIAAAYVRYARYLDPETNKRCDFFPAARFIARQGKMTDFWSGTKGENWSGRVFAIGFQLWKQEQIRPYFGEGTKVRFVRSVHAAKKQGISSRDRLAVWGARQPDGLSELENRLGLKAVRVEDGFLRSAGLGADFIPPRSLVFDDRGIYFNPGGESRLDHILNTTDFSVETIKQARELRNVIVERRLTKYNTRREDETPLNLPLARGKKVILVPGQVETDASIILGCGDIRTNLDLLARVRQDNPDAFIIYKPHPDVMAGNRRGRVHLRKALRYCDHVEKRASIISCIEAASEIHTMTSLSGFDALLRGRSVTCHGKPFYAGWGLTRDMLAIPHRARTLTLDELTAGALLLYPLYYDPAAGGFIEAKTAAMRLCDERARNKELPRAVGFFVKMLRYAVWTLKGALRKMADA